MVLFKGPREYPPREDQLKVEAPNHHLLLMLLAVMIAVAPRPVAGQKLLSYNPMAHSELGVSAVLSGDLAVIGRWHDSSLVIQGGSVLVFEAEPATGDWLQTATLTATDAQPWAAFGCAIDIAGETLVIGAFRDGQLGLDAGAAYVFLNHQTTGWAESEKLLAPNGEAGERFGSSVAISGRVVAIGAPLAPGPGCAKGAVYLFERDRNGWTMVNRIQPSEGEGSNGFGLALAIDAETLVVGGAKSGQAWIYKITPGGAVDLEATLQPALDGAASRFGRSVSVSGDLIAVGAPSGAGGDGEVYLYRRSGSRLPTWSQETVVSSPQPASGGLFGMAVALDGETLAVGAPLEGTDPRSGAVRTFKRNVGGLNAWGQLSSLVAPDPADGDHLGRSVALQGTRVLSGAYLEDEDGRSAGAAYVFDNTRYGTVIDRTSPPVRTTFDPLPEISATPKNITTTPPAGFFNVSVKELAPLYPGIDEVAAKLAAAHAVGASTKIHWEDLEAIQGQLEWAASDTVLSALTNGSLEPLVTVRGTPRWASASPLAEDYWTGPPASLVTWSNLLRSLIGRYGSNGSGLVHRWEIWNEPNQSSFFAGDEDAYVALLNAAFDTITSEDSAAEVWAPAVVFHPWSGERAWSFLDRVITQGRFHVLSIHLYFGSAAEMVAVVREIRQRLDDAGLAAMSIAVTEINNIEHGINCAAYGDLTGAVHAAYLNDVILALADEGIESVYWFKSSNRGQRCAAPDDFHEPHNGLLDGLQRPLPSYAAFKALAEGQQLVFADGFEAGDSTAWSGPCTPLTTAPPAMAGDRFELLWP